MSDTPTIYQRPEYALLVDERNAARRELAEAQAWMAEAKGVVWQLSRLTTPPTSNDRAYLTELFDRCPLPPDEDER